MDILHIICVMQCRGCRQKPLYDEPPTLDESKCPKEVKSHENEPMGAQKHTVDKHSSGGNVYIQNVYFQDIHGNVQLGRVNQGQSTVEVRICFTLMVHASQYIICGSIKAAEYHVCYHSSLLRSIRGPFCV